MLSFAELKFLNHFQTWPYSASFHSKRCLFLSLHTSRVVGDSKVVRILMWSNPALTNRFVFHKNRSWVFLSGSNSGRNNFETKTHFGLTDRNPINAETCLFGFTCLFKPEASEQASKRPFAQNSFSKSFFDFLLFGCCASTVMAFTFTPDFWKNLYPRLTGNFRQFSKFILDDLPVPRLPKSGLQH